jgi:hypothetical protein
MINNNKHQLLVPDQEQLKKKSINTVIRFFSLMIDYFRLNPPPSQIHNDQYKVPFFHLYETIYKFRHSIINLLEQNKFLSLADRLEMIKQLSSSDNNPTNDFVDNSDRVLKDTVKVLQTCMATITLTKTEHESKQKEIPTEQTKITIETPTNENPIIEQKESIIEDLNHKYQQVTQVIDENNKKHEEEVT